MILSLLFVLMVAQPVSGMAGMTPIPKPTGDRLVPLVSPADPRGQHCTADGRWCVLLVEDDDGGEQILPIIRAGDAAGPTPQPSVEEPFSNETYAVWPNLILLKDGGFLAGVETRMSTAYSGGGGSSTGLRLFRIAPDARAAATPILSVPINASLLIRACFGERDMEKRRGACHDEYSFAGKIGLAGEASAGLPILTYVTEARAFPRGVSRLGDSTTMVRLKKSDLVHQRDTECSFSRRFRFDAAAGTYTPETPLPDCAAYTVP
jgi:hypothetical protein